MKLSKARNLYLVCVLAVAVCVGGMSSCKNDKKGSHGQIDKKAVAQIGFYETYKYLDIAQDISNLFETAGNPTFFQSNGNYDGPAVCAAQKSDTAAINAIIAKYGPEILPSDLKLTWTLEPFDNLYELIALKTDTLGKPAMTGESIIEAKVTDTNGYGFAISITLDKEGGKQFSTLTSNNIGHALAVVFKDKVMSYPIVNSQVEGGKVEITGNFTEQVANDFVDMFYGKNKK